MAIAVVVEDENLLGKSLRDRLVAHGHSVQWFTTGEEAVAWCRENQADLALIDLRLPGIDGLEVLEALLADNPEMVAIMMTAHGDIQSAVRAMKLGASEFISKPFDLDALILLAERAMQQRRLSRIYTHRQKSEAEASALDRIVGECADVLKAKALVRRLASLGESIHEAPPSILITGETGTGKDLVARALHHEGPRRSRPFVQVNCAALPETLIESELFGHVKGAFTDARQSKRGLIELADEGTLFLDEIGTLPPALQAKLLTVLETGRFRPVGGVQERRVNIHVIAATNEDIEEAVRSGRFRQDLYHRLRVIHVHLPPLRERGRDLDLLVEYFLKQLCQRFHMPLKRVSPEAMEVLRRYPWPGNVRELQHWLESAVLLADEEIAVEHLPRPAGAPGGVEVRGGRETAVRVSFADGPVSLEQVERRLIEAALAHTGGNVSRAAELLGLTRDTLRYRIGKHEVKVPEG